MSNEPKQNKVIIDLSGRYFFNPYMNYLMKALINITLIVVLMDQIDMATFSGMLDLAILAMMFTVIEEAITYQVNRRFARYVFMSFGTILILSVIVAMSISYYMMSTVIVFRTMDTFFGFIVTFMLMRKLLSILLTSYLNRRRFERLIEKEVNRDV